MQLREVKNQYYPMVITSQMISIDQSIKKPWNISKRNCIKRAENRIKSQKKNTLRKKGIHQGRLLFLFFKTPT